MTAPTPAIVAQSAVRRLPRAALLLLCLAYVLPGFVGRQPWKAQDMTAFGYMFELARGATSWLSPTLVNQPPEFEALLPYWLGAWAIKLSPSWIAPNVAVRIPYVALLVLTLLATWYAVYHLARRPQAQPVAFAFGGEARPTDYARAIADAGLLALLACLGMGQLSHETTPSLAQLAFAAISFYGLAALPGRTWLPIVAVAAGLVGLALSGAPTMALLFAMGGAGLLLLPDEESGRRQRWIWAAVVAAIALALVDMATRLNLWRWRIDELPSPAGSVRLLVWFTWPAWPLALWTLWRWRRQLGSRHVALPLAMAAVSVVSAVSTSNSDRSLLLGLPPLAALAAFALPTFRRSVAALIDWFTLLFFTSWALVIWVVWVSLQTGVPAKPAANVARLAPGFTPSFSLLAFVAAVAGTLAWAGLVRWRVGRHRSALWKSLVLPAGGMTLCWLLVMTLWLPVLDYARSYVPTVRGVVQAVGPSPGCVEVAGLSRAQMAGLRYHGGLDLRATDGRTQCNWRIIPADLSAASLQGLHMGSWTLVATVRRPTDRQDTLLVYRFAKPAPASPT